MGKKNSITIRDAMCKQCGICTAVCPKKVLSQEFGKVPTVTAAENCIGCKLCQMCCPDFAIEVEVAS